MNDYIKHVESKSPLLKCWGEMYDIKEKLKRKYELEDMIDDIKHNTTDEQVDEYTKLCADIRKWAESDEEQGR